MTGKLRAERRRILRQYLKLVKRDFDRLYAVAKMMLVHSDRDQSELSSALLRQRMVFIYAFAAVQVRLALQQAGSAIDVRGLTDSLESLQLRIQQLAPAAGAA